MYIHIYIYNYFKNRYLGLPGVPQLLLYFGFSSLGFGFSSLGKSFAKFSLENKVGILLTYLIKKGWNLKKNNNYNNNYTNNNYIFFKINR